MHSLRCSQSNRVARSGQNTPLGQRRSSPRCGTVATDASTSEPGTMGLLPTSGSSPKTSTRGVILAFANPAWARAPGWDVTHLAVTEGGFSGVSFCTGDRSGVWFEGTAHLADALELRNESGDGLQAAAYLANIAYAQTHGLNGDNRGIIAAFEIPDQRLRWRQILRFTARRRYRVVRPCRRGRRSFSFAGQRGSLTR